MLIAVARNGSRHARIGDIAFGKVIQIDHVGMLCGTGWVKGLSLMESDLELLEKAGRGPDGALHKATITWHKRGNKRHAGWENTVLGRFLIDGDRLTIEVNSEKRAKRARKEVENRLESHATHKSAVLQSAESVMRERDEADEGGAEGNEERRELMSDPEVQGLLRKTAEAHWEKWYREKIPALGGRTPIQAAKTPDGRELLEALLIEYERNGERVSGSTSPDCQRMRERLGLTAGVTAPRRARKSF